MRGSRGNAIGQIIASSTRARERSAVITVAMAQATSDSALKTWCSARRPCGRNKARHAQAARLPQDSASANRCARRSEQQQRGAGGMAKHGDGGRMASGI
jgi:hypothetical protein